MFIIIIIIIMIIIIIKLVCDYYVIWPPQQLFGQKNWLAKNEFVRASERANERVCLFRSCLFNWHLSSKWLDDDDDDELQLPAKGYKSS